MCLLIINSGPSPSVAAMFNSTKVILDNIISCIKYSAVVMVQKCALNNESDCNYQPYENQGLYRRKLGSETWG